MATRWGIAGSGLICNDFAAGLKHLGPNEHEIVAVASRYLKDAEEFAAKWGVSAAYEGYQKLSEDPHVEVVYVGVINNIHYPVVKLLLEKGKHVLCEKSMCMNPKDVKNLVELAREKNLFLMEAIWSRCFPTYQKLQEVIADGTLGKVVHVNVTFGKYLLHVPRVLQREMGGGAAYDIGVYVYQMALLAFGGKRPVQIKAVGEVTTDGETVFDIAGVNFINKK